MSEAIQPRSGYPGPIASLDPWFFWTRTRLLGVTAEESAAIDRGENLSPERTAELRMRLESARASLISAEVNAARV
jgi:hypothetical protein